MAKYRSMEPGSNPIITTQNADITSGRILVKQMLKGGNNEELISTNDIAPGIYTVILYADKTIVETKKITIINK